MGSAKQRKPSFIHYCLAHACGISAWGGVLVAFVLTTQVYLADGVFLLKARYLALAMLAYVPAGLLGLVLGLFPGWMIVGNIVSWIQGAPFREGDTVCVLSGKHRGKVTTVYEVWECRGQVRVDLGKELKKAVEDVFCNVAVFKMRSAESDASPSPREGPSAQN
jgi:hypothetical protein